MEDQIVNTSGVITVTKHAHPTATVSSVLNKRKSCRGILKGKLNIPDEVLMADYSDLYDCIRERETTEL